MAKAKRECGPRKSVIVMHEGNTKTLQEICNLKGLKMSTVYNRVRGLFKAGSNAIILNSDDAVFSPEKSQTSAKCFAVFNNGDVVRCRVSEALRRDYAVLVTKKGYIVGGKLAEYSSLEEYDASVAAEPVAEEPVEG